MSDCRRSLFESLITRFEAGARDFRELRHAMVIGPSRTLSAMAVSGDGLKASWWSRPHHDDPVAEAIRLIGEAIVPGAPGEHDLVAHNGIVLATGERRGL